ACALCERDDARRLVTKDGWHVVRCRQCGLVYVNPRPTFDALAGIYTDGDYCAAQIHAADDVKRLRQSARRLRLIEQHYFCPERSGGAPLDATRERGRLFDVGCSTGVFLRVARDAGWEVSGIDVSAAAVEHARRVYQLDAHVATLEQFAANAVGNGSRSVPLFDVITMFDSLEHMPQPLAALRAAYQLLKDDGWLVITTPNIDGLFPRFTYRLFAQTLGAWEHPTPPGHTYQFSRQTLHAVLRKSGFDVVYCRTEAIPAAYTVGKLEEAIISALNRGDGRDGGDAKDARDAAPTPHRPNVPNASMSKLVRRAVRLGVRAVCWGLTLALSAPAPLLNQGDSMIVFARKDKR
ncbi:MAG: class I SAM-dependent methyltransferase, partial [Abditibacteriales bacterium]|nr:class I SAM-dependent methyltransferase [Abditibacteriales bacterium]MDW8366969.1 class I SAM-dependent methyltransferase [Abditibacteriales bacterium]